MAVEEPCPTCPTGTFSFRTSWNFLFTHLSLDKYKWIKLIQFCPLYFIFWLIITSSHVALKTVWIQINWLLKKPADLDLHCLQDRWYLVVYCFESVNCLSTERFKLICSFGQVHFSLDKYIMALYLSLDKWIILIFPHPCILHTPKVCIMLKMLKCKQLSAFLHLWAW